MYGCARGLVTHTRVASTRALVGLRLVGDQADVIERRAGKGPVDAHLHLIGSFLTYLGDARHWTNATASRLPGLLRRLNSAAVLRAILRRRARFASRDLAHNRPFEAHGQPRGRASARTGVPGRGRRGPAPNRPRRRPRLLRFASGMGHVLGIDIGANKVLAIVADLTGEVLAVERRKTGCTDRDSDALLALVDDAVSPALDSAGSKPRA